MVHPAFPAANFIAEATPQLEPLELKGRVAVIAAGLRRHLPPDYPTAIGRLLAILGPPHTEAEGMFTDGCFLIPVAAFVEHYGLEHLDESFQAMHAITQRHTTEFDIRPFLQRGGGAGARGRGLAQRTTIGAVKVLSGGTSGSNERW